MNKIVKLNVGGRSFITSEATLFSKGENFFTSLLSDHIPSIKDELGAYFIDRNGDYFGPILDYLRTGALTKPKHLNTQILEKEANFYCITLPLKSIPNVKKEHKVIQFEWNSLIEREEKLLQLEELLNEGWTFHASFGSTNETLILQREVKS